MMETPLVVDTENRSSHSYIYGVGLNDDLLIDMSDEENVKRYFEQKELFDENWYRVESLLEKASIRWHISEK